MNQILPRNFQYQVRFCDRTLGLVYRALAIARLLGRDCGLAGYEHKGCGPTNRLRGGSAGMVGIMRAAELN